MASRVVANGRLGGIIYAFTLYVNGGKHRVHKEDLSRMELEVVSIRLWAVLLLSSFSF